MGRRILKEEGTRVRLPHNSSLMGTDLEQDQICMAYNISGNGKYNSIACSKLARSRVFLTILKAYKAFDSLVLSLDM